MYNLKKLSDQAKDYTKAYAKQYNLLALEDFILLEAIYFSHLAYLIRQSFEFSYLI